LRRGHQYAIEWFIEWYSGILALAETVEGLTHVGTWNLLAIDSAME
jgi:hypothetical protein